MIKLAVGGRRGSKGGCAWLLLRERNVASGWSALGTKAAKTFES